MNPRRPIYYAVVAAIIVGYIAFRIWDLTASCLWFDEIFSVHAAEHSWSSILQFVAQDLIHPPLFYILLKLWIGIGGEGLFWLRLLPVTFSVLAVFPFLALCREVKRDVPQTTLALLLFAINGPLLKYAQEVRMYSLLLGLGLFSMWLFVRYLRGGKGFVWLVLINVLMVYSHYFGWFVVSAEVLAVILFQRTRVRQTFVMFDVVFASFLPWAVAVWQALSTGSDLGQNIGWMTRPGPQAVGQFVLNLLEPFYYSASSLDPLSIYRISLPLLLIAAVAIILYFVKWKQHNEDERRTAKLLTLSTLFPLVAAFIASWMLSYSIWGTRHLIIVFAPVSIFLAIAVSRINIPKMRTAAITLIVLFSGYAFVLHATSEKQEYSWCAWEPLAIEARAADNSNIYVFEDLVAYHIWFGLRNSDPGPRVLKVIDIDGIPEDKAYFLPRGFDGVGRVTVSEITDQRLWIAYRATTMDQNEPPLRNFQLRGYHVVDQRAITAGSESSIFLLLEK